MLKVNKDIASFNGHRMVEVFCGYCKETSSMRKTALKTARSCGCLKNIEEYLVGKEFTSKHGDVAEVLSHERGSKVKIKFIGYQDNTKVVRVSRLKSGDFDNPIKIKYFGIGFLSEPSVADKPHYKRIKSVWLKVLARCYDPKCREYSFYGQKGVTVCDEWHDFKNFYYWYSLEIVDTSFKYQIDKDLFSGSRKLYSPETCCLLPKEVNMALVRRVQTMDFSEPRKVRASISIHGDKRETAVCETAEQAKDFLDSHFKNRISEFADKYVDVITHRVYNKLKNL